MNLRAAASGSLPLVTTRGARRRTPEEEHLGADENVPSHDYGWRSRLDSSDMTIPGVTASDTDELGCAGTTRRSTTGFMRGQQHYIDGADASVPSFPLGISQATAAASMSTPTKTRATTGTSRSLGKLFDRSDCLPRVPRCTTPMTPSTPAAGKVRMYVGSAEYS